VGERILIFKEILIEIEQAVSFLNENRLYSNLSPFS
jgi:hypothetical protein